MGFDRDVYGGQAQFSRLDDVFHRIAIAGQADHAQSSFARVSPKSAGRIGHGRAGNGSDDPASPRLQQLLDRRELFDGPSLSITDDDICLALQHWRYELGNVLLRILVIAIGVDDNVCT